MEAIGRINKVQYHTIRGYDFEWQIPEFVPLDLPDDISSPTFSFAGALWCLRMYLNCMAKDDIGMIIRRNDGIGLFLRRKSSGSPISLDFSLGLKINGTKYKEVHRSHIFREAEKGFGIPNWISYDDDMVIRNMQVLPSNSLTVFCTLRYSESEEDENVVSLRQDYKKVLLEGENHDLILKVGNTEFRAHRDILRARSKVFQSMLNHNTTEKNSGIVDVPDCDPQAMELFLSYIYCGKVETLNQSNMFGLYYMADKYEMLALKEECSEFIKKSLSTTNICKAIQLASSHNDSNLLKFATGYFESNMTDIMRTDDWQYFLKNNFTLGNELVIKCVEKHKAKKRKRM